jgi:hypothetical protein
MFVNVFNRCGTAQRPFPTGINTDAPKPNVNVHGRINDRDERATELIRRACLVERLPVGS